jgi:hypothetical protein
MTEGTERFANREEELVRRARGDLDFTLRLLHRESREQAIREIHPHLSDVEMREFHARLDDLARMSFEEALERFRDEDFGLLV